MKIGLELSELQGFLEKSSSSANAVSAQIEKGQWITVGPLGAELAPWHRGHVPSALEPIGF